MHFVAPPHALVAVGQPGAVIMNLMLCLQVPVSHVSTEVFGPVISLCCGLIVTLSGVFILVSRMVFSCLLPPRLVRQLAFVLLPVFRPFFLWYLIR